jgi:hypothetical protein
VTTAEQKSKNVQAFESLVRVAAFGDVPIAPLASWYALAPIDPIGAHWYFGFDCPACGRLSPLFRDFSDGHLGNPFSKYGLLAICYLCKKNVRCPSEHIRSAQWPLEPGQSPVRSEYSNRVARRYKDDPEYRPVSGPLHHYTSVDALLSIIKTKSLWATNVRYLNDSSESELGLSVMREIAEEARKTAADLDAQILEYAIDWLDSGRLDNAAVYVLSFSAAHNQLGQWRGYTRYGQGICLSIDAGLLVQRMQAQGWTFQNCRYKRTSQLTWAEAILARVRREAATRVVGAGGYSRTDFDSVVQSCLSDLLQVAATIKHESFEQEQEVRFISPLINIDDHRVGYRPGRTKRIPYVEFRLADDAEKVALQEVMIGPGPNQAFVRASVIEALRQNPCTVSLCRIPYREL